MLSKKQRRGKRFDFLINPKNKFLPLLIRDSSGHTKNESSPGYHVTTFLAIY